MLILHLSDIHIKDYNDPILYKSEEIASCTYKYLDLVDNMFIVISGDLTFSGQSEQFCCVQMFLEDIVTFIKKYKVGIDIKFIITPGNHDCDFTHNSSVRDIVIQKMLTTDLSLNLDEEQIEECTKVQNNFFDFAQKIDSTTLNSYDKLFYSKEFNIRGNIVVFDTVNSSWLSQKNEEYGKLRPFFPETKYKNNIRILVMHHPYQWFKNNRDFRQNLLGYSVIITGHEHLDNFGVINDIERGEIHFIEGGVLVEHDNSVDSCFNIIHFDIDSSKVYYNKYSLKNDKYKNDDKKEISLHIKSLNPFPINQPFLIKLDEPGAAYMHHEKIVLKLSDFYIYPEMDKLTYIDDKKEILSSERLKNPEKGIISIIGEEKSGKTSLLYSLFQYYHGIGFVPLIINGHDIKSGKSKDIDNMISRTVKEQYGEEYLDEYFKLSKDKKVLLIDDFNRSVKKREEHNNILDVVRSRYEYVILTVSNNFETDLRNIKIASQYQLKQFGHRLRSKLISKWIGLGDASQLSDDDVLTRHDDIAKILNHAIQMDVIPSVPFYLIILIRTVIAGDTRNLLEGGLNSYYEYLFVQSLLRVDVRPDKISGIKEYLKLFIGWLFKKKITVVSDDEFREFNVYFSKEFHHIPFEERLDLLMKAKIIMRRSDGDYDFYYQYLYYYLKAEFMHDHINDEYIKKYIRNCCKHLYVKDYANTILFLVNARFNDFILEELSETLSHVFDKSFPIAFCNDTSKVLALFNDAPDKITFNDDLTPMEIREKSNSDKDEANIEIYSYEEKNEEELGYFDEAIILVTTMNIVSRILKSNYEKIKKSNKLTLLYEYFNAPLRAINNFYDYIVKYKDDIVLEIENKIKDTKNKEKITKSVKDYLRFSVEIISFGYIYYASSGMSKDLEEQTKEISKKSPAHNLIYFFSKLKQPGDIPVSDLRKIVFEFKFEPIAVSVIRHGVLQRLYMFASTLENKQQISGIEQLGININNIRKIENKADKHRLLGKG